MARANFSKWLTRELTYEGGFSNHPEDPGGITLEGIIQRVYDGYRQRKGRPLQALTAKMRSTAAWKAERNEIYRLQYWDKIRGDELPAGVDLVVGDGAVNSGPVQSIKWLQRAVGVTADGVLGEATMAAVLAHPDHDALIADICARRLAMLRQLRTWGTFGKGWARRVSNVMAAGQALAAGSVGPAPVPAHEDGGNAKAPESDLATAPVRVGAAASATTAGTVVTGAADQLQDTAAAIQPLADGIQIVKYVVLAITIVVAGIMLYGIYRNWKAERARRGEDSVAVPEFA
jgi:lysozyme family protein